MKKKPKKATKNDIVVVINRLIYELESLKQKVDGLLYAFDTYVEMKKDTEKFIKEIKKKTNKEKESGKPSGVSSRGDKRK